MEFPAMMQSQTSLIENPGTRRNETKPGHGFIFVWLRSSFAEARVQDEEAQLFLLEGRS